VIDSVPCTPARWWPASRTGGVRARLLIATRRGSQGMSNVARSRGICRTGCSCSQTFQRRRSYFEKRYVEARCPGASSLTDGAHRDRVLSPPICQHRQGSLAEDGGRFRRNTLRMPMTIRAPSDRHGSDVRDSSAVPRRSGCRRSEKIEVDARRGRDLDGRRAGSSCRSAKQHVEQRRSTRMSRDRGTRRFGGGCWRNEMSKPSACRLAHIRRMPRGQDKSPRRKLIPCSARAETAGGAALLPPSCSASHQRGEECAGRTGGRGPAGEAGPPKFAELHDCCRPSNVTRRLLAHDAASGDRHKERLTRFLASAAGECKFTPVECGPPTISGRITRAVARVVRPGCLPPCESR